MAKELPTADHCTKTNCIQGSLAEGCCHLCVSPKGSRTSPGYGHQLPSPMMQARVSPETRLLLRL
jgi:hypothetical protein